jgi:hypothetical protein
MVTVLGLSEAASAALIAASAASFASCMASGEAGTSGRRSPSLFILSLACAEFPQLFEA